jgi:hypothetical protein
MRSATAAVLALAATVLAACGGGDRRATSEQDDPTTRPPATRATGPAAPPDRCATPLPPAPGAAIGATQARAIVDAAAGAATTRPHRFRTQLVVDADGLPQLDATLIGRRAADGSSAGVLRWRGPAALVLPEARVRVADDRIRIATADSAWRNLGSASGVALDVGRELLVHPFLLELRDARGVSRNLDARLVAPTASLRDYATAERQGPVTELLAQTRSLVLDARVVDDALVRDRFVLRTTVPSSFPLAGPVGGRTVTIRGTTRYC